MAEKHDKSYRLLFSHPEMVEDLIRQFVGGKWIKWLDFTTLEKVSERDLSLELIRREKDLLWRLRWNDPRTGAGGWFFVYLHLEFQSTTNRFMALRVATHKLLLWEDLLRLGILTSNDLLPPILSLVLYTGKVPWKALSVFPT